MNQPNHQSQDEESEQLGLAFPKDLRLRSTGEFRRCYDQGQRAGDDHLLVFALQNATDQTRVGVSVSKKHGNAVKRNRKKRLLREAFRLVQHELPAGLDLVLVPRQRPDTTLAQYRDSLQRLVARIYRRFERGGAQSS
jgi:ribonuclease P protein component